MSIHATSSATAPAVRHNPDASRFECEIDGMLCRADYHLDGKRMQMYNTEVPRALEGRGIAARLVRAAFDHAQRHGLQVIPSCSYVRAWARRHPEVRELVAPQYRD